MRAALARERTAAVNALTALLRVVELGMDARKPLTGTKINTIAAWRERDEEFGVQTCRREAIRLAKEIIRNLKRYITRQIYRELNGTDNGLAVLH